MQSVHTGALPSSDASRIMYHCRMQYLKSREGRDKSRRQRRKSSLDLYELNEKNDKPQFSCLDEKVHGPCTSEILVPPSELMTRPRAFRQAYWRHHCKPTVHAIEKLEIYQLDERKERLNKKRKEILAKIRKSEARKREKDMRRRAERVLRHSNSGLDSEESGDDCSDSELEEQMGMMSLSPSQYSRDDVSGSSSPGRRKMRSSIAMKPKRDRRTIVGNLAAEDDEADDSFAFLSDWASMRQKKIRW